VPPRVSLAGQFLLLQLCIVLVVVGVVAAVSLAEADASFRRIEGRRLLSVAENVAVNDTVRLQLKDKGATEATASIAETSRAFSGASFIQLTDSVGYLLTGPDAGRRAELGSSQVLSGQAWVGVSHSGARALVAHVPVLDGEGQVIGAVIAGRVYPTWIEQLSLARSGLISYLLIGGVLGVVGSLLLARRVKRQTLGLEPREITGLVEQREAMLHGIREGVIGTDTANRITLVNDEAVRLLGLPADAVGRSLHARSIAGEVGDVLTGRVTAADQVVLGGDRVLVLSRMPVILRGRHSGWITTLRDRTELTSMQRELDVSRHATDTLRAQAHEFSNRLHTISGLVQLGDYDEVIRFITTASQARESLTNEVTSRIADPALAALLIAKASLAAEQGVTLTVAPGTAMGPVAEKISDDLVTIVGNLVDNALDAVDSGGWVEVEMRAGDAEVCVCVRDSGPGVAPELVDEVFRRGYTTKAAADGHGGLGLALTRLVCVRRGGSITVTGSTFTARVPCTASVP
jgi:two-component system, CitB family, sensor kinase